MNKFMINLKVKYEEFSKSEKKIADFLLSTPTQEMPLYITDLAKLCQTSEATVVRFAKRLGYDGYQQLKIAIAQESSSKPINENIKQEDPPTIFSERYAKIFTVLWKKRKIPFPNRRFKIVAKNF